MKIDKPINSVAQYRNIIKLQKVFFEWIAKKNYRQTHEMDYMLYASVIKSIFWLKSYNIFTKEWKSNNDFQWRLKMCSYRDLTPWEWLASKVTPQGKLLTIDQILNKNRFWKNLFKILWVIPLWVTPKGYTTDNVLSPN